MSFQSNDFKIPVAKDKIANNNNNLPLRGFTIVVATCGDQLGIGRDDTIPWRCPEDMKHFAEVTKTTTGPNAAVKANAVIMGRKTYESIPSKFRPLAGRVNIVLTNSETWSPPAEELANAKAKGTDDSSKTDVIVMRGCGLAGALAELAKSPLADKVQRVFNIGGASIYKQAAERPCVSVLQNILVTKVPTSLLDKPAEPMSVFFPSLKEFEAAGGIELVEDSVPKPLVGAEGAATAAATAATAVVHSYVPRNEEEMQYLRLIRSCMERGITKEDRTGVGTIGYFGAQMRFSLRDGRLPLLTTKRVFWKGVCEELIWFLRGETDSKLLEAKNVNIWKGNGSREFLDSRGLSGNEVGELGPVYGFQWRHFGADYDKAHSNYDGKGIDQIKRIVEALKKNPNDRRMLLTAWNPCAIDKMALPPCHVLAQFWADVERNELSCMLYQRSCDMGLGIPFNIASYSLLTLLICRATGFKPGDFVHTLGDVHVYKNHVDPLKEQLARVPRAFPFLRVVRDREFLEDYEFGDFEVMDYLPYPTIQMEMAV